MAGSHNDNRDQSCNGEAGMTANKPHSVLICSLLSNLKSSLGEVACRIIKIGWASISVWLTEDSCQDCMVLNRNWIDDLI